MTDWQTELLVLIQVDDICEEFESLFAQGKSPQVANFLDRVKREHRSTLVHELVSLEVSLLRGRGDNLSAEKLLERYASFLPNDEDLDALRPTIEKAIDSTGQNADGGPSATVSWDDQLSRTDRAFPEIDGFEIESELGHGAMGIVYKAVQTSLNRPVALKMILLDEPSSSAEHLERFEKEAKAVAELNDPHFVQIYEFGQHNGRPYMALELVDGGSLEQYRRREPQPERFAAEIAEQLSRAMHKAHAAGLVHRDLKPHNVLLGSDGRPKITDFGLVKRQNQDETQITEHGRVMGTASYMAPEQSRGNADVGAAADLHALGGIIYCLLTGRPPFLGATVHDTILQVRNEDPVAPSRLRRGVSKDLETICLKCLQKEPDKRYSSAVGLADDLRRFLDGRPIVARPAGPIEHTWRWCGRNPVVSTLISLLVLAIVGGFAGIFVQWRRAEQEASTSRVTADRYRWLADSERAKSALAERYYRQLREILNSAAAASDLAQCRRAVIEARQLADRIYAEVDKLHPDDLHERMGEGWLRLRFGQLAELEGQLAGAEAMYSEAWEFFKRLAEEYPGVSEHHEYLAESYVRLGMVCQRSKRRKEAESKWQAARNIVQGLVGEHPDVPEYHRQLAVLHLLLNDRQGHGDACKEMLNRFAESDNQDAVLLAVHSATLAPDAIQDKHSLVKLAESTLRTNDAKNHRFTSTLAAALCRAGEFEAAINQFQQPGELTEESDELTEAAGTPRPRDWLFLAIAHCGLGEAGHARQCLRRAAGSADVRGMTTRNETGGESRRQSGPWALTWIEQLESVVLQRELEAMLKASKDISN